MKLFIDTNIFLRFLQADNPKQSPKCKMLFENASKGKINLVTNSMVIAEIIWVLDSFYELPKKEIVKKLHIILLFEALEIPEKNLLISSLNLYEKYNLDFIDAYCLVWLKFNKIDKIYSFDRDFDKIEGVERMEPK